MDDDAVGGGEQPAPTVMGTSPDMIRCSACGAELASSGALRYHRPAQGFVCPDCRPASGPDLAADARGMLAGFFRLPPDALGGETGPAARALESFHRDLIGAHLERDLRAPRVIRETLREAAR